MKKQNGITLIALIITIVVLLILAVVAIGAVKDGGIIEHAQNAADKYESEKQKEEGILEGYVSKIEHINIPDELVKYILGPNGTGRLITEVYDHNTGVFIDDPDTEEDETVTLKVERIKISTDTSNNKIYAEIKYNGGCYGVTLDLTTMFSKKIEEIYVPRGNEGRKVKYDSDLDGKPEEWTVITDRNGKLEIVSNTARGNLRLVGIEGYNDAINKINNKCKEIVKAKDNDGVRSVGASTDTAGSYSSENFDAWYIGTEKLKDEDNSYEEDYRKLICWGILDTEKDYWMASRVISEKTDSEGTECIRFMLSCYSPQHPSEILYMIMFEVNNTGNTREQSPEFGLRPVVINPKNIEYVN